MSGSRSPAEAPRIDPREAKAHFDRGTALFVDVRSPEEYQRSHLPGALSIPLKGLFLRPEELPRDRSIIFY